MIAVLLTVVISFLIGGVLWLTLGSRLTLNGDKDVNEIQNLIVYVGAALVPVFIAVFFLLDRN